LNRPLIDPNMLSRAFAFIQYLLPRHWLTAIIYHVARIRIKRVKNALISAFVRFYRVDLDEVSREVPDAFQSFNDFFIRELKDDARPIDSRPMSIVSPVDGTVTQAGQLQADSILQAKGLHYSLDDLLAADLDDARAFRDGSYATFYLAPYNYHRVHAPLAGELVAAHYVPGDLFSVNAATVLHIAGLLHRNERLILHIATAHGRMALIFVGALNVGSISTRWGGEIRPRKSGVVEMLDTSTHPRRIEKGELLGWFNMGSTVIVLLPRGVCDWRHDLTTGTTLRMGESIGEIAR
jgi:phosphatidylserine decarboxylase